MCMAIAGIRRGLELRRFSARRPGHLMLGGQTREKRLADVGPRRLISSPHLLQAGARGVRGRGAPIIRLVRQQTRQRKRGSP